MEESKKDIERKRANIIMKIVEPLNDLAKPIVCTSSQKIYGDTSDYIFNQLCNTHRISNYYNLMDPIFNILIDINSSQSISRLLRKCKD